jgi:hypothetical protein
MNRLIQVCAAAMFLSVGMAIGSVHAQAHAAGPPEVALGPADLYVVTQTSQDTPFQIDSGQLAEQQGGTQAIRS